jgi:TIR domain
LGVGCGHRGGDTIQLSAQSFGGRDSEMHDVFISYARHDAEIAEALANILTSAGLVVWLDRHSIRSGEAFDKEIEEGIAAAAAVVVVWSKNAIGSHWVRAEAAFALSHDKLLPIKIDDSDPPLQFLQIQTLDFRAWDRTAQSPAISELIGSVRRIKGAPAPDTAPAVPKTISWRTWAERWGLLFEDRTVEVRFAHYFRERYFWVLQLALVLALLTYLAYGLSDILESSGGLIASRFRFMVAAPITLAFLGLAFVKSLRPYWQWIAFAYTLVGSVLVFASVVIFERETGYEITRSQTTLNMMIVLTFIGLNPLRTVLTLISAVLPVTLQVVYFGLNPGLLSEFVIRNTFHLVSVATVVVIASYVRERVLRRTFTGP